MKRTVFLSLIFWFINSFSGDAQAQVSSSGAIAFAYSPSLLRYSNFTLTRSGDSYSSVRLRGLSVDFSGLIRDAYTDYLRNPAVVPTKDRNEIYGDLGAVSDNGKFLLGSYSRSGNQGLGVFANLEGLIERNSTNSDVDNRATFVNTINTMNSTMNLANSMIGANVRYTYLRDDGVSLGASYQYYYRKSVNNRSNGYSSTSTSGTNYYSNQYGNDLQNSGPQNKIVVGAYFPSSDASFETYASGTISAFHLNDVSVSKYGTDTYLNTNENYYPSTVEEKSGLVGVIYEKRNEESSSVRYLFEFGYTSYSGTGSYRYESKYGNLSQLLTSFANSTRGSDGTI